MRLHDRALSSTLRASRRHTVRVTSIIGIAAMANIAFGMIRMKIVAIVLGPIGIGMIGLLQNLLNAAATIGGLNLGVAGARQIVASESSNSDAATTVRQAVFLTTVVFAVGSGLVFWLFRDALAGLLLQDHSRAREVGWLAIGVAATAGAGYQAAILSAGRRIGDIARISLLTAAAAALVGSFSIIWWKSGGIIPFILATPVAALAIGAIFVRRAVGRLEPRSTDTLTPHVISLIKLGAILTISIFVSLCGQLAVRTLVERRLGGTALGHFQAAWTITTVYLAFIFQAMASDYLPRLTAAIEDRADVQKLVDGQAEVGFLLAAPILLIMIGAAPWLLSLFYSSEFVEATTLFRYQMMGDLLRLGVWPVALVLLAGGASHEYALADITATVTLVAATAILLPVLGLSAPGLAYIGMNVVFGAMIMFLVYRRYFVVIGAHVFAMFAVLAASCATIFAISSKVALAGAIIGLAGATVWASYAYLRLRVTDETPRNNKDPQEGAR